jgi:uncharacterized protein (DUF488 family)
LSQDIYTIGHSNHLVGDFIALLKCHSIGVVADVRSHPYSARFPDYGREKLRHHLASSGVRYVFMGDQLGARPEDPACYVAGAVDFGLLRQNASFREGVSRLARGCQEHRICLMCAEKEPADCHRAILVGQAAHEAGIQIVHILADGSLEPHERLLLRIAGGESDCIELFGSDDRIALSLARRAGRIAFRNDEEDGE